MYLKSRDQHVNFTFKTHTEKVWIQLINVIHDIVTLGTSVAVLQTLADTPETTGGRKQLSQTAQGLNMWSVARHRQVWHFLKVCLGVSSSADTCRHHWYMKWSSDTTQMIHMLLCWDFKQLVSQTNCLQPQRHSPETVSTLRHVRLFDHFEANGAEKVQQQKKSWLVEFNTQLFQNTHLRQLTTRSRCFYPRMSLRGRCKAGFGGGLSSCCPRTRRVCSERGTRSGTTGRRPKLAPTSPRRLLSSFERGQHFPSCYRYLWRRCCSHHQQHHRRRRRRLSSRCCCCLCQALSSPLRRSAVAGYLTWSEAD